LQGAFTATAGKRIAPYLPKVIGAWLSGTFDSDKTVSRSAQDALDKSFPTQEKQRAVWKLYQRSLVEYAEDAILHQTPQTLSDERSTSPDDAEAKHVRVVGTATLVLCQLLRGITDSPNDASGYAKYAQLLTSERLWEFTYHQDPFVRRGICSLVTLCVAQLPSELNWKLLSTCFLAKSLHASQIGSALQYAEALLAMTRAHPPTWTEEYHGKTTAHKRLFQYLRHGSQRGPESVWSTLGQLIINIPVEVWSAQSKPSIDEGNALLAALHEGVSNPDESRQNASAAWSTYVGICFWVADLLEGDQEALFEQTLIPLIYQYVDESSEQSQWRPPSTAAPRVCSECLIGLWSRDQSDLIGRIWTTLADRLIDAMKMSLPETSREFKASQDSVIAKAKRLGSLQIEFTKRIPEGLPLVTKANARLFEAAALLLETRNGKPYGAAGVIQELSLASSFRLTDDFLIIQLPRLLASPSGERLIAIFLKYCRSSPAFSNSLQASINVFLHDAKLRSTSAYRTLLRGLSQSDMTQNTTLEQTVLKDLHSLLIGENTDWGFVKAVADNPMSGNDHVSTEVPAGYKSRVIEEMMHALSIENEQSAALQGFEAILPQTQSSTGQPAYIGELLSKLLLLADSPDERTADRATQLSSRVKKLAGSQGSDMVAKSTAELITQQLSGTGQLIS
jgi:E3 ubiquitin-protein ligase listerin